MERSIYKQELIRHNASIASNMKLLGNRIILREIEPKEKKTAIILIEKPKSPFIKGIVEEVGNEVTAIKPKDIVLVNRQIAGLVEWGDEMIYLVAEEDIIAFE